MIINKTIYQVDAFTDKPFRGNSAGVIFVDSSFSERRMQQVAMEMNLSETAFIIEKEDSFSIRFFTPTVEIPLCGHATLASAHIIWEIGLLEKSKPITFHTLNDELSVYLKKDWITMSFPSSTIKRTDIPANFESIIDCQPTQLYKTDTGWKIAILATETEVKQASPKFEEMNNNDFGLLMLTSESNLKGIDFVVRCFAPQSGINEDPVTGSAQCGLVPLWNLITKKNSFECKQLSERTGILKVGLHKNRVLISGQALTIFEAQLKI